MLKNNFFQTIISRLKKLFDIRLAISLLAGYSIPTPKTGPELMEEYRKTIPFNNNQFVISFLKNGETNGSLFVMIHGTPGAATGWADYVKNPPSKSEIIAIDRLGFGKSSSTRSFPKLTDQVAALYQIIPPDREKIILVGHSLGAPVAALYAAKYPDKIQAIIFLAGSFDPALEKIHPMQYFANWAFVRPLLSRSIRNANEELLALKPELEALTPLLSKITAKTIIVHGENDDLVPVQNVLFLEKNLTSAKHIKTFVISGQNHFLPWNSEAIVREAMEIAAS